MKVFVVVPDTVDGAAVTRELSLCGCDASFRTLGQQTPVTVPSGIDRAVLALPRMGVVDIGEQVEIMREVIGADVPLLVCCQQLTPNDRRVILKCGASSIVTPRGWSASEVAERILGEFILNGDVKPTHCGDVWGGTAVMQNLYRQIETLAPLAETVLILGETGSGKERVAQELHSRSRRPGELLAVNSAEFTPELLGSELFGHERGAFSGAEKKRAGLLVAAGAGTFFLDEIGDLAPSAQAKLLRVLEERKVRPVGANHFEPMRARLILATRRNVEDAPDEQFRRDLFERLRGFIIRVPPLRERRADLPLLVRRFAEEYNREYPGDRKIPPHALDALFRHDWPGNVRELRLAVRQAAAYAPGPEGSISALHLLDAAQRRRGQENHNGHSISFDPSTESWKQVEGRARANYIRAVLKVTEGNKDAAAHRAGLSRSQLYAILKGLDDESP